jgi:hypothetical protein
MFKLSRTNRQFAVRRLVPATLLALVPLLGAAPTVAVHADGICSPNGNQVQCTFASTGAAQAWTVPAGVTSATFDLYGAAGGDSGGFSFAHAPGGHGAHMQATLGVTPGATIQVMVGGQGGTNGNEAGGFNGGGGRGEIGNSFPLAGGGGGGSDIRFNSSSGCSTTANGCGLADRLLVSGGGGGAAGFGAGSGPGGLGGPAGGAGGMSGASGSPATGSTQAGAGTAGGGGTVTSGGPGGKGGTGGLGIGSGTNGSNGQLGQGGSTAQIGFNGGDGGGGGGGYYGGGEGGQGGADFLSDTSAGGGGGGGGSSFATSSATGVTLTDGVQAGDGKVVVTYTPPLDTTAPKASPSQSPAANAAVWNNTDVTITWNWTDADGPTDIDPNNCTTSSTSSGEGSKLTLTATCSDKAGNTGSASYNVNVDKTPPTVSAAPTTQPNANGWYNAPVRVHFTCNDALSGVASCPADQVLSSEGSAVLSTPQTATDVAGNVSAPSNVVTVKIDETAPTASPTQSPVANASGWSNTDVTVNWNWTDSSGGSGIDPANCLSSSKSNGEGVLTLNGTCQDLAGNVSHAVYTVKVDKTAPVSTLTAAAGSLGRGLPLISVIGSATVKNQAGSVLGTVPFSCWDSQGLKLNLAATDSGSGVAGLTFAASGAQTIAATNVNGASAQVAISNHGRTTLIFAATDNAGNTDATHSETLIVGHGFACATPTPSFSMPDAGTLVLSGTATVGGSSYPFNQTIPFD